MIYCNLKNRKKLLELKHEVVYDTSCINFMVCLHSFGKSLHCKSLVYCWKYVGTFHMHNTLYRRSTLPRHITTRVTPCNLSLTSFSCQDNVSGESKATRPHRKEMKFSTSFVRPTMRLDYFPRFHGSKGHFTCELRAVTMKLWEPKRKCPKAIPIHFQNKV